MSEDYSESFDRWWYSEGSGMPPIPGEEASDHVERVSRIAWANGASNAKHSAIVQPIPLSDRMPEPGEMDGGLVWAGFKAPGLPYWEWCIDDIYSSCSTGYTHWLPANTKHLPARVEG